MAKSTLRYVGLATAALVLVSGTAAYGQAIHQTPLAQPIQTGETVGVARQSNCGFLTAAPIQVLQVNEPFVSLDITVNGNSNNNPNNLSLLIEGSNGFRECLTSDPYNPGSIKAPGLLNQGRYAFYIGNSQAGSVTYSLSIRQNQ